MSTLPNFSEPITDLRPILEYLEGRVGELGLYCQNAACVVRAFTLQLKPYGELVPVKPCCPFCRSEKDILFSYVRTREEVDQHALEMALFRLASELIRSEHDFINLGEVWRKVEELRLRFVRPKS